MIHWLFLIYWVCKYTYTGEFNDLPSERNFLILMLGFLENGFWIGIYEVLKRLRSKNND